MFISIMEDKRKSYKLAAYYKRLRELEIDCLDSRRNTETAAFRIAHGPRQIPLSDILSNKSISSKDYQKNLLANKRDAGNKLIRTNFTHLFKQPPSQPLVPQGFVRKNFKIGKSFETGQRKSSNVGITPRENIKIEIKDKNENQRSASLDNPTAKHNPDTNLPDHQHQIKKADRPPLPKTLNQLKRRQEDQKKQNTDTSVNSVKVNVNVEIITNGQTHVAKANLVKVPNLPKAPVSKAAIKKAVGSRQVGQPQILVKRPSEGCLIVEPSIQTEETSEDGFSIPEATGLIELLKQRGLAIDNEIRGKILNLEKTVIQAAENNLKQSRIKGIEKRRENHLSNTLQESDDLKNHEHFVSGRRSSLNNRADESASKRSTPNLMLNSSMEQSGDHQKSLKRNNSAICLSTNSKNKIKWFMSDNITRALFHRICKEPIGLGLDDSLMKQT